MQVIAERLMSRRDRPLGLFDSPWTVSRSVILSRAKREINERHGRFAVRSATTLPLTEVYDDFETGHDICDVRGKMCF
jgi:DNA polymerase V